MNLPQVYMCSPWKSSLKFFVCVEARGQWHKADNH